MNDLIRVSSSILSVVLSVAACGGGGSDGTTTSSSTGTGTGSSTTGSTSTTTTSGSALLSLAANSKIDLDTCGGTVASNVPDFFKTYFKCANLSMSVDGANVIVGFQGLPPYTSAYYSKTHPNYITFATDQTGKACTAGQMAGQASGCYTQNPNTFTQKSITVTIPINPVAKGIDVNASTAQINNTSGDKLDYSSAVVGVALNGIPLFSGFAARGDNIADEAFTFDGHGGHPTGQSFYHYHRYSGGPLEVLKKIGLTASITPGSPSSGGVELYGITCDGVLVMGTTELDGSTPAGSLDAQSGHSHDIKDKSGTTHFINRYHTHISPTSTYKYVPELQYYTSCTSTGG